MKPIKEYYMIVSGDCSGQIRLNDDGHGSKMTRSKALSDIDFKIANTFPKNGCDDLMMPLSEIPSFFLNNSLDIKRYLRYIK